MKRLEFLFAGLTMALLLLPAAPASAGDYKYYTACEYRNRTFQGLPTHYCQLKMKKAAYFKSKRYDNISWYYCVDYPRTTGGGHHGGGGGGLHGGHNHRHRLFETPQFRVTTRPAVTRCYPPGGFDDVYRAKQGVLYRVWLHTHRRGPHWVTWRVLYESGWRTVGKWRFFNALHIHV